MNNIQSLNDWLTPLTKELSLGQRKRLLQSIKKYLVSINQQRIKSQTNPDGSTFIPRVAAIESKGLRNKRGPMFSKLRTAQHLRATATADQAVIGFKGRSSYIANQHQEGLTDTSGKYPINTPKRQLLGITADDEQHIMDMVFMQLAEH